MLFQKQPKSMHQKEHFDMLTSSANCQKSDKDSSEEKLLKQTSK